MDGKDFGIAIGAPRQKITEMGSLDFVERSQETMKFGQSGVGKTHLAILLGYLATQHG